MSTVDETLILDAWSPVTEKTKRAAFDLPTQLVRNLAAAPRAGYRMIMGRPTKHSMHSLNVVLSNI